MRNLKRVLSLALASIMLLGMMVIGASAADKTYADLTDSEKISNKEAVSLLVDLGVITGKTDGSYAPAETVDRATMAKLITMMLMGDVDQASFQGTKTDLKDIDKSWAEGYIKFCYSNGIITGDGKGNFFPTEPVTVVQAAKMLLVAVGYDATDRGYVGDNWSVNIMRDAQSTTEWSRTVTAEGPVYKTGSTRSLTKGISVKANDPLTRDNAAQMIFNTLFVTNKKPVYAFDMGKQYISSYSDVSSLATTTYDGLYQVKGVLDSVDAANKTASIGDQPSVKLSAETGDIGSTVAYYRDTNGLVSSAAVATTADVLATSHDGTDFSKLLTRGQTGYLGLTLDENVSLYVNGDRSKTDTFTGKIGDVTYTNNDGIYYTGTDTDKNLLITEGKKHDEIGSVIEFLDADSNGKVDTIKITEYTLSTVTKVTAEKSDGTEATVSIKGAKTIDESLVVGDFAALSKDDVVLYAKIGDMYYVYEPETITGTMTRYNDAKNTMLIDGTTYTAAGTKNDTDMKDAQGFTGNNESKFYLDANGYVVAVDGIEGETKYAVVDAIAYVPGSGATPEGYFEAKLIFNDGTTETVNVDKLGKTDLAAKNGVESTVTGTYAKAEISSKAGMNLDYTNCIYTYKTDSDGNYELTRVAEDASFKMDKGVASVNGETANNDTVYVYKTKDGSKFVLTVYTGYKNAPTTAAAANVAVASKNGYAKFVFVDATDTTAGDTTSDIIVFLSNAGVEYVDGDPIYLYNASLNGKVDTYQSKDKLTPAYNTVLKITVDKDGYISKPETASDYTAAVATANASAGALKTNTKINDIPNATLTFDGSETVYVIDADDDVTVGDAADIKAGTYFWVKTVSTTDTADKLAMKVVYVLGADGDATLDTLTVTSTATLSEKTKLRTDAVSVSEVKAAGKTVTVTATDDSLGLTEITIEGEGTKATSTLAGDASASYTIVKEDLGKNLTVTVTNYESGKDAVTNTYTIAVTGTPWSTPTTPST